MSSSRRASISSNPAQTSNKSQSKPSSKATKPEDAQIGAKSSVKSSIVPVANKLASLNDQSKQSSPSSKKPSYLNDVTEKDIKDDKYRKRYDNLMAKFVEITKAEERSASGRRASSASSTGGVKVKPKEEKEIGKKTVLAPVATSSSSKPPLSPRPSLTNSAGGGSSSSKLAKLPPLGHSRESLSVAGAKTGELKPVVAPSTSGINKKPADSKKQESSSSDDDDDDSSSEEDERVKPVKAPTELLEEFLVYVMSKKWEDAHKLCKFILMYEPHNQYAKEFLPLIESKLNPDETSSSDSSSSSDGEFDVYDSKEEEESDEDDENDDSSSSSSDSDDDDEAKTSSKKPDDVGAEKKEENKPVELAVAVADKLKIAQKQEETDDDDDVQIPSKMNTARSVSKY